MNIDSADKLTVRITFNDRFSSGFIYPNLTHTYIFTAKHAVCKKDAIECWKSKKIKCEKCSTPQITKTKIEIDRPDIPNFRKLEVKDVIYTEERDIAVLILKENCHKKLDNLPMVNIPTRDEIEQHKNFLSCGYPAISSHEDTQPICYENYSKYREKFHLRILNSSIANLEYSKDNLAGNSGAGIVISGTNEILLVGIYTETGGMNEGYGEYIDDNYNNKLIEKGYPIINYNNKNGFEVLIKKNFMDCFNEIEHEIEFPIKRELNLYRLALDGKNYNYKFINRRIFDCIPFFTLSRKQIKQSIINEESTYEFYQSVKKFLKLNSENKIAEILLQGFLETYKNAPKLYSSHYNEKSVFQGAHIRFKEDDDRKVEIIHCIALFSPTLQKSLVKAIKEILLKFPDLKPFGGLIDSGFMDENYSEEESKILARLIIPDGNKVKNTYQDRLAIFIGYDKNIESPLRYLQQDEFEEKLNLMIIQDVMQSINEIEDELESLNLVSASIDCFFVPFEDTDKFHKDFIESL